MRGAILGFALLACAPQQGLVIEVVDEAGEPVDEALLWLGDASYSADTQGRISLQDIQLPALTVVEAPGMLSEPVVVGLSDQGTTMQVRVLDDRGGRRVAMHFGGDFMMGRRYLSPKEGPALLGDNVAADACDVVSDLAPAFGAADLRVLNLESVVGDVPLTEAYPGKRWLIQTPPEALEALHSMSVDVAVLGNNHQRDWLDVGMASTLQAVDASGLLRVGAGNDEAEAALPLTVEAGQAKIGLLSYAGVDGSFANDAYPLDGDAMPANVSADYEWLWEARQWGHARSGVAESSRRIGSVWQVIKAVEPQLSSADRAALWSAVEAVYPELQDWVARRGHGGANLLELDRMADEIEQLATQADAVVVNLHTGFQFATTPSAYTRRSARVAIDAGADLVIAHHPHVLQGIEWYRGRLIVYSLGNFTFDQDFLSTFPSAFARVVWDIDEGLVEARMVPFYLDGYRPVPVSDGLARDVIRAMWGRSLAPASAVKGSDAWVRPVLESDGVVSAHFRWEHGTARIIEELPASQSIFVDVPSGGAGVIPGNVLSVPPTDADVWVGRQVSGAGDFDDADTDDEIGEPALWVWSDYDVRTATRDAYSGVQSLELTRGPASELAVLARPIARASLPEHRLYGDGDGLAARDGDAQYSIRMMAQLRGQQGLAVARAVLYHFDDVNPNQAPTSSILHTVDLQLPELGTDWQEVVLELPSTALEPVDGLKPNAALIYLLLNPPNTYTTTLRVDDVGLIEWRLGSEEPWPAAAYDFLRTESGQAARVEIQVIPW